MQLSSVIRRFLFIVAIILPAVYASARSVISVKEEEYNDMEPTAQIDAHRDRWGKVMALVIVHNAEPEGYQFEADGARVENATLKTGEKVIKLYLPQNTKSMRIKHSDPTIQGITYTFENAPLQSAQTYHLTLNPVYSAMRTGQQYLVFNVTPPSAILEVEEDPAGQPGKYVPWPLTDGMARKLMRYGTYRYQLRAADYYPSAGSVTVSDPESPVVEEINLRPRFGYLTIRPTADLEGAVIFIDGLMAGTSSLDRHLLSSGRHQIKIDKRLFKMYETMVEIADGEEVTIAPELESNAGRVTLTTPDREARILLREGMDNRYLGTGSWSGPLEPGDYLITVSRPGHADATKQISVRLDGANSFTLPVPVPQYGSINVTSTPAGAQVTVDGKNVGATPRVLNNILEGDHTVLVSTPGYSDYETIVTVTRDAVTDVHATLTNQITFTITGEPGFEVTDALSGAALQPADDGTYTVLRGTKVRISGSRPGSGGYYDYGYSTTREIDMPGDVNFRIPRPMLGYKEFYISLGYAWSGYSAGEVAIGYTFNHFNAELFGQVGGKSAEVYRYAVNAPAVQQKASSKVSAAFGLKFGYSLRLGTRLRVTPRAGIKILAGKNTDFDGVDSPAMMSLPVEVLVNFQLAPHVSIFAAPAYRISLGEKPHTAVLYDSNKYWTEGPAVSAGISFNF